MPPFRRAKPPTGPSEGLDTVLDLTVEGLEAAKDTIVDALSVPGMGTVMSVAIGILKKVQAAKSNRAALGSLQTEMESLVNTLQGVANAVQTALPVDVYPEGSSARKQAKDEAFKSAGLVERVAELERVLTPIIADADKLSKRNCFGRILHSTGDAGAINDMKDRIVVAHRNFQTVGGVMIEAKVTAALSDIKIVIAKQEAAEDERVLSSIPKADEAHFLSAANAAKSRLQEGTRELIFESLEGWVAAHLQDTGDGTQRVRILVGEAGTGKSTVASEFSKRLKRDNLLVASYFFTRGVQDLNSPKKFFSTLAWQFAQSHSALRRPVVDAARQHLKIGALQQLERQFEDLIAKPLDSLPSHPPIFVVVDGLDECTEEGPQLVPSMLRLLLSAAVKPGSPLRVFLASRPEPQYIHNVFTTSDVQPHISLMTMREFSVRRDIECLFRAELNKHPTSRAWSDADSEIVDRLVRKSDGLFVYARTAVDFILNDPDDLSSIQERYDIIMTDKKGLGLAPIDTLYRTVLENVFPPGDRLLPKTAERLTRILQYLFALQEDPRIWMTPAVLENLTGMPMTESVPILNKLRSVVLFERDDVHSEFRIMHATFREFLVDQSRAGDAFYVSAEEAHGRLADECTAAMRSFVAKNWTNTAADAMVILQFFLNYPSILHFRYECQFRDDHLRLRTSTSQDSERQMIVDSDPHPIPSFVSFFHDTGYGILFDLVRSVVKQLRGSLSGGDIWQYVVSSLDNLVQDTSRLQVGFEELVATLCIILDIQAMESRCVFDATPGGRVCTTTGTASTLDDQHVQDLAIALNKAPTAGIIFNALIEAHVNFHRAIVAAGLSPGHQFEDEWSDKAEEERGRQWRLRTIKHST